MADEKAILFSAQVFKIQTLVDGGLRLTLDLCMPYEDKTIVALFDARQPGIILECAAVAVTSEKLTKVDDETKKSTEGSGTHVDRRRVTNR